jgi:hypothetical protein
MKRPTTPLTVELLESGTTQTDAMRDRIKLIRKLRWIGLEEEAQQLMSTLPYDNMTGEGLRPGIHLVQTLKSECISDTSGDLEQIAGFRAKVLRQFDRTFVASRPEPEQ